MVEPEAPSQAEVVSTPVACQLIMVSRQRIEQLVADGWIKRHTRGQYRLVDVVQGYIKFLRDERSRFNIKAADSRVRDARVHEIEVRTAERMGRLVDVDELYFLANTLAGLVRTEHVGAGARITRDLALRHGRSRHARSGQSCRRWRFSKEHHSLNLTIVVRVTLVT